MAVSYQLSAVSNFVSGFQMTCGIHKKLIATRA